MALSEADTRAKLIDPALYARGWTEEHIKREETAGAIDMVDGRPRRRDGGRMSALLHAMEAVSEREVFLAYEIGGDDLASVLAETGIPVGWYPMVVGYDIIPQTPQDVALRVELGALLTTHERRAPVADELKRLKLRLQAVYKAGPRAGADAPSEQAGEADGDEAEAAPGATIPAETVLEELSQKLRSTPSPSTGSSRRCGSRRGWSVPRS